VCILRGFRKSPCQVSEGSDDCCKQAISPTITKIDIVGEIAIFRQLAIVGHQDKAKRPDPTRKNALDFVVILAQ
jgi:hypothetical protein